MRQRRCGFSGIAFLLLYLLVPALCCSRGAASSFRSNAIGARARGMGGAYVAIADDTTACYWNPAGLAFCPCQLTQVEERLDNIHVEYTPPGGSPQHNIPHAIFLPTAGTIIPLHHPDFPALGLLLDVPYGFRLDWQRNAAYRYNVTFDEIHVLSLGGGTAYKPNECFAVGIAAFANTADVTLENAVPSLVYAGRPGLPDASFKAVGNDMSTNFHLGALWWANQTLRFGAVYRSPIDLTLRGDASLAIPAIRTISDGWVLPLNLPQSVAAGAAWQATPLLLVAVQADWVDWSSIHTETISFLNGALPNQVIARNWKGRTQLRIGAEYAVCPALLLRAGYSYDPSPVPDNTLDPMLFDLSRHILSVGFGTSPCNHWSLDASYEHQFGQPRTAADSLHIPPTNGRYSGEVDIYTVTVSYRP